MRLSPSNLARIALLAPLFAPTLAHAKDHFPEVINLPLGFQPEGITRAPGNKLFVASIGTGDILKLDPRTGESTVLVPPQPHASVGIKFDRRTNLLYVAGGPSGHGFVYDACTGAQVADLPLAPGAPTFINDVLVTDRAVYFTESMQALLYRVPLRKGGRLPHDPDVDVLTLGGDYKNVPNQFNANGIEFTPDGKDLLIVNSVLGTLYRVDPDTGVAHVFDLGGGNVINGDGLVLRDRTLYVVENFSNAIAVVKLDRHADRGRIIDTITNPNFQIPATAAFFKGALYVTQARFDVPLTPTTQYTVVRVPIDD
jgi:sugar lactone lactonase YvrE